MEAELKKLREQLSALAAQLQSLQTDHQTLRAEHATLQASHEKLRAENNMLRRQNGFLRKQLFGKKSEKLDRNQLELLLGVEEADSVIESEEDDDEGPPAGSRQRRRRRTERKVRIPEGTPSEEVIIDPDEVKADPEAYECIGEELSKELDVVPHPYFLRITRRRKYKSKTDRSRPPLLAPMPPRLIEGSLASPGLLVDITLKKYMDHLPLYRQERTLRSRYGIDLSRKTMCDWIGKVSDWLKPIYNQMSRDLRQSGYLQVDETPVRYLFGKGGGSRKGYLWVYHDPGGDVVYDWHQGRGAACLKGMLEGFSGTVQCDGYKAYTSYAKGREEIELAGCWAHARRTFFESLEEAPGLARWMLHQIGLLYRIESELRSEGVGPPIREATRVSQSAMILGRIEKALRLKMSKHLPKSQMGKAIAYTLGQWDRLLKYRDDGRLEIDNNQVENAIRPTALGKKNYLFFGAPEAGQRSAIIYTILESCKRRGINQAEYLRDVLERLPSMTNQQTWELTPVNWLAARQNQAA